MPCYAKFQFSNFRRNRQHQAVVAIFIENQIFQIGHIYLCVIAGYSKIVAKEIQLWLRFRLSASSHSFDLPIWFYIYLIIFILIFFSFALRRQFGCQVIFQNFYLLLVLGYFIFVTFYLLLDGLLFWCRIPRFLAAVLWVGTITEGRSRFSLFFHFFQIIIEIFALSQTATCFRFFLSQSHFVRRRWDHKSTIRLQLWFVGILGQSIIFQINQMCPIRQDSNIVISTALADSS